jgi:hypothetical protein
MARSINFDGTDMSTYNLTVTTPGFNILKQLVSRVQLQNRGYAFRPMREPRIITVEYAVTGTSLADLDSNLDSIREILTLLVPAKLIFDSLDTRYFNAILSSFEVSIVIILYFRGHYHLYAPTRLAIRPL